MVPGACSVTKRLIAAAKATKLYRLPFEMPELRTEVERSRVIVNAFRARIRSLRNDILDARDVVLWLLWGRGKVGGRCGLRVIAARVRGDRQ